MVVRVHCCYMLEILSCAQRTLNYIGSPYLSVDALFLFRRTHAMRAYCCFSKTPCFCGKVTEVMMELTQ